MEHIENRTFDEIQIGDTATLERTLTEQDIKQHTGGEKPATDQLVTRSTPPSSRRRDGTSCRKRELRTRRAS
ncbi:MAG: hypothetical protein ACXWCY_33620 [Burkholderiales bacterium]